MTKLTKRQAEILHLIETHIATTGAPPTRAEIAAAMKFRSPNAAEDHLRALARKGYIKLVPGTSRGIRLTRSDNQSSNDAIINQRGLPIIGAVAAGNPILAQEHIETYQEIDKAMFKPTTDYLLRVKGDSMINAGILNGDLLAVHATPVANQGQIVVARIDYDVTVKRFYQNGQIVTLKAENPDFHDITVDLQSHTLTIEGIVVGVLRNLH